MKVDKNRIIKILGEHDRHIRNFGVKKLALFGSAARDEHGHDSDLDFLVEFSRDTFDNYMDLKFYLENLFVCSVDLVIEKTIKPRLKNSILEDAIHVPGL